MSPVIGMIGGFVIAALTIYCIRALYKRYLNKIGREQVPTDVICGDQRNEILYSRLLPIFNPLFPDLCRTGETVSFQIIFPGILKNNSTTYDSRLQNQLLTLLSMSMKYQNDPTTSLNPYENFPIMSEFQPITEGAQDVVLISKFSVKQAGLYELAIKYQNIDIRGTPFKKIFFAGFLDPDCTIFQRKSPAILCVTSVPHYAIIEPRDRHDNRCQIHDVDLNLFSVKITEVESSKKGELVEPVSYYFSQDSDEYGNLQPTVRLQLELFYPGVFQGAICYQNHIIQNGTFEIVCLTSEENDKFRAVLLSNPGSVYHEAQLLQLGTVPSKKKKVFVYVAPQVLSVKEFFFGFIPAQIVSYRVIPATRVQLLTVSGDVCTVSISDRMQLEVRLEISTSLAHVVIAMFFFFLQQRLGGSETFDNKQKFFYQELRKIVSEKDRPSTTVININRNSVIDSTLKETRSFGGREWCKKFKIKFIDEEGVDEGGLRREWLDLMCRQMFENSGDTGMFKSIGNSRLVLPNPKRDPSYTLRHYELAGRIVGKCLFETAIGGHFKQMVNARFGKSFLSQIIGFPPHYKYFEHDDPEFYNSKIKYLLETKDVTDMDLTFSEEVYDGNGKLVTIIELVSKGASLAVTNENKLQYLKALAQYRLYDMMKQEIQSFIKGLNEIVPFGLLTNFDENELEILMCGHSKVTVEDLRNFHVLTPSNEIHCTKIVTWFWTAVENMNDSERGRLLQFVSGSSLLPHGGFQCLEPRFRITIYGTRSKLPICHSCFNEICLSNHDTYEEFERSLKTAITEGSEGFGFN